MSDKMKTIKFLHAGVSVVSVPSAKGYKKVYVKVNQQTVKSLNKSINHNSYLPYIESQYDENCAAFFIDHFVWKEEGVFAVGEATSLFKAKGRAIAPAFMPNGDPLLRKSIKTKPMSIIGVPQCAGKIIKGKIKSLKTFKLSTKKQD